LIDILSPGFPSSLSFSSSSSVLSASSDKGPPLPSESLYFSKNFKNSSKAAIITFFDSSDFSLTSKSSKLSIVLCVMSLSLPTFSPSSTAFKNS
jgi:hypothetical protein